MEKCHYMLSCQAVAVVAAADLIRVGRHRVLTCVKMPMMGRSLTALPLLPALTTALGGNLCHKIHTVSLKPTATSCRGDQAA